MPGSTLIDAISSTGMSDGSACPSGGVDRNAVDQDEHVPRAKSPDVEARYAFAAGANGNARQQLQRVGERVRPGQGNVFGGDGAYRAGALAGGLCGGDDNFAESIGLRFLRT